MWVPLADTECPHCGAGQGIGASVQAFFRQLIPKSEAPRRAGRLCVACDRLVGADDTHCPHCGVAQTGARKAARAAAELLPAHLTASNWIIVGCCLLFVVPLLAFTNVPDFEAGDYFWGSGGRGAALALILMGGMFEPLLDDGQWWRVVTPVFLHDGVIHLGMNMYALTVLGPMVENLYGRGWFFFLWVATGVACAAASWIGTPQLSIGASGALFGLIGIGIAQAYRHRHLNQALLRTLSMWAAFGFLLGLIMGFDNWAHGGGFVAGIALSFALPAEKVSRPRSRARIGAYLGWAALALCALSFYLALSFAAKELQLYSPG